MTTQRFHRASVIAVMAAMVAGCQINKSANPLSPTIAGPIEGVQITPPNILEPAQDWQIRMRDQPIRLMFRNAGTSGVRPLSYTVEIASDPAFKSVVFKRTDIAPGSGETTTFQLTDTLPTGHTYWWRVRAEDGANVGEWSKPVSFTAITPVTLGAPVPQSPTGTLLTTVPEFKVGAGSKSGPYQGIVYTLQVANDSAFRSIAAIFIVPEAGSQTTVAQNYSFLNDKTYYWRVQAKDTGQSEAVSAWSTVRSFSTAVPAPTPAPDPGGVFGGGDTSKCGPPYKTDPLGILQCHRNAYPATMSENQYVSFLRGSSKDFNRAGVAGGPFGLLVKDGGANCGGYSCDIICAGQGNSQKQWDVLIDGRYANWGTPLTLATHPLMKVRPCEIQ
jgi:hypothetical protein